MNTSIKDLWEKVKKPKKWFSILYIILTLAVIAATIVLLCLNLSNTWYAYILYGVSAIVLTYAVYIVVYFVPDMRNATIKMLERHFEVAIYKRLVDKLDIGSKIEENVCENMPSENQIEQEIQRIYRGRGR